MELRITLTEDDRHSTMQMYLMAEGMWHTLWDMDQWLRAQGKYNDKLSDKESEMVDTVRERLFEIMNEHGVDLGRVE